MISELTVNTYCYQPYLVIPLVSLLLEKILGVPLLIGEIITIVLYILYRIDVSFERQHQTASTPTSPTTPNTPINRELRTPPPIHRRLSDPVVVYADISNHSEVGIGGVRITAEQRVTPESCYT